MEKDGWFLKYLRIGIVCLSKLKVRKKLYPRFGETMKIPEALKQKAGIRIVLGNNLMFWDGNNWLVYEVGIYGPSTLIIQTESEEDAVTEL